MSDDDTKPYTMGDLPASWKHDTRANAARLRATVEALEKAEAERDEAQRWVAAQQSVVADVLRERDEARAEVARVVKFHDDVERYWEESEAHNAALREALEGLLDDMAHTGPQDGDRALYDVSVSRLSMARAALATDAGTWLREFARKCVEAGRREELVAPMQRRRTTEAVVEEVCK
jgi:5'-deoxynucleotidase YfbR-like HD superfamily hydrolase